MGLGNMEGEKQSCWNQTVKYEGRFFTEDLFACVRACVCV